MQPFRKWLLPSSGREWEALNDLSRGHPVVLKYNIKIKQILRQRQLSHTL
jgi:hypothetical protein